MSAFDPDQRRWQGAAPKAARTWCLLRLARAVGDPRRTCSVVQLLFRCRAIWRDPQTMPRVAIIGAGLAGSLLAIYLAERGLEVDVYEARGDMRQEDVAGGRSINLALSDRGIAALRE